MTQSDSLSGLIVAAAIVIGLFYAIHTAVERRKEECLIARFLDQKISEKFNTSTPSFSTDRNDIKMTDEDCNSVITVGHEMTRERIDTLQIPAEKLGEMDEPTRQKMIGCIKDYLKSDNNVDASMFVKVLSDWAMKIKSDELHAKLNARAMDACSEQ